MGKPSTTVWVFGGGGSGLAVALAFYHLHHRVTEEEEWYADYLLALGLCFLMYGGIALLVRRASAAAPAPAAAAKEEFTANPVSEEGAEEGAEETPGPEPEPEPEPEPAPTGVPGPFVLAIALFVCAVAVALTLFAMADFSTIVSHADYDTFTSFGPFALAVAAGATHRGGVRLLIPSAGIAANGTVTVSDRLRVLVEGAQPEASAADPSRNAASLEVAPLYAGSGRAFTVQRGGMLDLVYLMIANRTESGACEDVPCDGGGAAVYVESGGTLSATRVVFRGLRTTYGDGGAISSYGLLRLRESWFVDCSAGRWAGAVAILEGGAAVGAVNSVEDCTFARCSAEDGGAMDVGVENFRLRRSHFVDNFVTSDQCANLTPAPFAWPIMAAEGRRTCALQRGLAWEWRGAADLDSDLLVGA